MKHSGIIGIGSIYLDINAPNFPFTKDGIKIETEVVGGEYEAVPGSSAVNFSRLCAQLELESIFVGKVGNDTVGRLLPTLLKEAGVTPQLITSAEVSTNVAINLANPEGDLLGMVVGSANQSLHASEVLEKVTSLLDDAEYLYLGGCLKLKTLIPAYEKLVQIAKAHNVKVIVDHGRVTNSVTSEERVHVKNLVRQADYYFPSKDELCDLWEVATIEEGLQKLATINTIVKDSTNGAWALVDGQAFNVPCFTVKAQHVVGAGDSFNAGFMAAQKMGKNLEESMRFGCAVAALKISRPALPTLQEVEAFLSQ